MTPTMAVSIQVWCGSCGAAMCDRSRVVEEGRRHHGLHVDACRQCIDNAYAEGKADADAEWQGKVADAEEETRRVIGECRDLEKQVYRALDRADAAEQKEPTHDDAAERAAANYARTSMDVGS